MLAEKSEKRIILITPENRSPFNFVAVKFIHSMDVHNSILFQTKGITINW